YSPVWSPNGSHIAFGARRKGPIDLYERPLSGGSESAVLETPENKWPLDWSADERSLLYRMSSINNGYDLWVLPLDGERKPFRLIEGRFDKSDGRFSPDAHWVAYQSNESSKDEIYLQAFPAQGNKWQISVKGGAHPVWGRGGKEIYYVAPDDRLMAVPLSLNPNGASVDVGSPSALFSLRGDFDALPDGERFLVANPVGETSIPPINVVL